jgi:hypothetical protein
MSFFVYNCMITKKVLADQNRPYNIVYETRSVNY